VTWLCAREDRGDEIVVHGFYHLNTTGITSASSWFWNRIYTTNEAEFVGLGFDLARSRIKAGRQRLLDAGLHPVGFIAPAWLLDQEVTKAVFESGFSYTNTISSLISASGHTIHSRSLCYSARSEWRRRGSLLWNALLWWLKQGDDLLRLSVHPGDLYHHSLRKQISATLTHAMQVDYIPTTYRDIVVGDTQ
jgi:predicted deacetylase